MIIPIGILVPTAAATAAVITLVARLAWQRLRPREFAPELPPPPDPPAPPPEQKPEERRPMAAEPRPKNKPIEPKPPDPHQARAEAQGIAPRQVERTAAAAVEEVISRVTFSAKRVQVGVMKTGERAIGVRQEESPFPGDSIDVRPLRDLQELPFLLPSELGNTEDMMFARIASGDALVQVHVAGVRIMEDVHEPVWEERNRILYVLWDRSGSMYDHECGGEWKTRVWRGVLGQLMDRTIRAEATLLLREFHEKVGELRRATREDEATPLRRLILENKSQGGTKIEQAILAAIGDLAGQAYHEARILILSDGEDTALDIQKIRALLDEANIRLHAILLGTKNDALRACADVYQIVNADLSVQPSVIRQS